MSNKKSSFSILKGNPRLTGNIKLLVSENSLNSGIFIETIDAFPELTRSKFKGYKINNNTSWSADVYNFCSFGSLDPKLLFNTNPNQFDRQGTDFKNQYFTDYNQGVYPKISKLYTEQFSYFVPTWFEPSNIPNYFAIFRVEGPLSNFENNIVDKEFFNLAKLVKTFDLTSNSTIGKYIRKHTSDPNFPNSPMTVNYDKTLSSTVNGISFRKSGFTKENISFFDEMLSIDKTLIESNNWLTNQFMNNSVICANMINMEFLFDDPTANDYSINRYYGFYFNTNPVNYFTLSPEKYYTTKSENFQEFSNISSPSYINILDDNEIIIKNKDGVHLVSDNSFIDYANDISKRVMYVKSTD